MTEQPKITQDAVKRLDINTPMIAVAQAVKVLSHFIFEDSKTGKQNDFSLLLVSNIKKDEVCPINLELSTAQIFKLDWLKFSAMARLGLCASVGGKRGDQVVQVAQNGLGGGTGEQRAGFLTKARDFMHDRL